MKQRISEADLMIHYFEWLTIDKSVGVVETSEKRGVDLLTIRMLTIDLKTNHLRLCMEIESSQHEHENEKSRMSQF